MIIDHVSNIPTYHCSLNTKDNISYCTLHLNTAKDMIKPSDVLNRILSKISLRDPTGFKPSVLFAATFQLLYFLRHELYQWLLTGTVIS